MTLMVVVKMSSAFSLLPPPRTPTATLFSVNKRRNRAFALYDRSDDNENESINPNDLETPEERRRRMEMVRKIQKSFYSLPDEEEQVKSSSTDGNAQKNSGMPTILHQVPLWRVQWTELPGYQNLLNCHVDTHMFHLLLSRPKPWFFGHMYLPGGSENLDNPDYRLLPLDSDNTTKACYTGTLMQVSDYKQLEDGRLALVVQALERFQVLEATQHSPYAVATVQLLPDIELALEHYSAARQLALELSDDFLHDADAWGAANAAALECAGQYREFEYRPVEVRESTMGAVSPLVNFDENIDAGAQLSTNTNNESLTTRIKEVMEKHLCSASPMPVPSNFDDFSIEQVLHLEHDVWLGVDTLVQLLSQLMGDPGQARMSPVPTQMLGLLPRGSCDEVFHEAWPKGFVLEQFASRLEDYAGSMVGTHSKSPYVRYDYADSNHWKYPALRRAQRLSFVVWILMDSIGLLGEGAGGDDEASRPLSRQEVLEFASITERLEAAKSRLDAINDTLRTATKQL